MTDLSPVTNSLDFDPQSASGRPNDGQSDSKMVAGQSGRGVRRPVRGDSSAARSPLEQQHHELLEAASERAAREAEQEESRRRQEIARRDQNSIAARTRASVKATGAKTSVDNRVEDGAESGFDLHEEDRRGAEQRGERVGGSGAQK